MAANFHITGDPGETGVFDLRAEDDLNDPVDVNWLRWNVREICERSSRQWGVRRDTGNAEGFVNSTAGIRELDVMCQLLLSWMSASCGGSSGAFRTGMAMRVS